jgi:5-methylcytosine-specific restriction protein A
MDLTENYVYKKEVDWSLLTEGLTLPIENQVVFGRNMGRFLNRGEAREIHLFFEGRSYKAQIRNVK